MKGGFSSCDGIMFYDTAKQGDNAVYAYYQGDEIVTKKGTYAEIKDFRLRREEEYKRKDKSSEKVMGILFLIMMALIVLGFVFCSFFKGVFLALIFVASYIPVLGLCFVNMNTYENLELHEQFKRYHGCEHAVFNVLRNEKEITMENIKSMNIYDPECGSVYMGYILTLFFILIIICLNFSVIGMLKAIGIIIISVVALFFNIFNPLNPFMILQKNAVATPTEREYLLGLELLRKFKEL